MKNLVWLASYPKSGNTWFRVFLQNLLDEKNQIANINDLEFPIVSSRDILDEYSGIASSDLTEEETESLRPEVYKTFNDELESLYFLKVHDAYIFTKEGKPVFLSEITHATIHIVRNPLDVAVSYAHHSDRKIEAMIKIMGKENHTYSESTRKTWQQIRQRLFSWSGHYYSWKNAKSMNIILVRYEDMVNNIFDTFSKIVKHIGLDVTDEKIKQSIQHSSFEELQKQEKERGFMERSPSSSNFFRKGKIGSWREEMTKEQAKKIIEQHKDAMIELNYLTATGELLV